jgi:hypothetical protein
MRIAHAIAAVLTISFATTALTAAFTTSALAAPKGVRAKMAEMKAKDPQNYEACLNLSRQRGFRPDTETSSGLMMFVDGCIMGRQR